MTEEVRSIDGKAIHAVKEVGTVVAISMNGRGFWVQYKGRPGWVLIAPVVWAIDVLFELLPGESCPSCRKRVGRKLARKLVLERAGERPEEESEE